MATGEHAPDDVQPDDPTPAAPALEPRPLAAEPARRPDDGDMLLAAPAARRYAVGQAPGRRRLKVAIPAPVPRVDVSAALNEPLAPACLASHAAAGPHRNFGCLDQIVVNRRCTHLDFRIAYYIAHRMDRATGEARIRQSDIAEAVQVTSRAVQLSTERLRSLGHPGQYGYEGGIVRLISATSAAEVNDSRAINSIVGQF